MLTLASGERLLPTEKSKELYTYSKEALHRLSTDLFFWNLFQVHWLHTFHLRRLGPDLGGWALDGYPPCTRQAAAGNLMVYAGYKFLLLDTKTRVGLPLTEGLIRFTGNPLRILPGGKAGFWKEGKFLDITTLCLSQGLTPEEAYALFITTIEEQ